jgi:hypothetical protein
VGALPGSMALTMSYVVSSRSCTVIMQQVL